MAEINPPAYEQAGSYSAQQDRMAYCALLTPGPAVGPFSPLGGVRPDSSGLDVSALSTPGMAVQVNPGTAFVPATIPLNAGWTCFNNGTKTVTIAAASGSHPRIDLIIAHVYDATDDVGTMSAWAIEAVTGTAAASPVVPALPANAIPLAQVTVPQSATAITSGNVADERNWMVALGGILPTVSGQLPAQPYPGQAVWCADTGSVLVYQGAISPNPHTWQSVATGPGPWQNTQASPAVWTVPGTWTFISYWAALAFTAPPSGSVFVTVTAGVGNGGSSDVARIGWSVFDPAVGYSGPNFRGFSFAHAVASQDGLLHRASVRNLVTGLTPGTVLNARTGYFFGTGSPQDDGLGELIVEAVP